MNLNELYSELIMEHNSSSHNRRHLHNPTVMEMGHNPSCGDEIQLELIVKEGVIKDASFTGTGCAISQASTSMMIDLIRDKTVDEAKVLINLFIGMIKREIKNEDELEKLEDAAVLKNISNMPARVKCAVLAWHTLDECI